MTGTCDACKAADVHVERDRRIPRLWGGTYDQANCHSLCLICHQRKNELERQRRFSNTPERHEEWLALAFPLPVPLEAIEYVDAWYEAGPKPAEPQEMTPERRRLLLHLKGLLICRQIRLQVEEDAEAKERAAIRQVYVQAWDDTVREMVARGLSWRDDNGKLCVGSRRA